MQDELPRGISQDHFPIISVISVLTEITDIVAVKARSAGGML
jgi:hypothetical protein